MVEIGTVNRDLKIKIGQIAGVAEVQNILTKRNKTTMKAEVSVVKIKNCKFLMAIYFKLHFTLLAIFMYWVAWSHFDRPPTPNKPEKMMLNVC